MLTIPPVGPPVSVNVPVVEEVTVRLIATGAAGLPVNENPKLLTTGAELDAWKLSGAWAAVAPTYTGGTDAGVIVTPVGRLADKPRFTLPLNPPDGVSITVSGTAAPP